MNQNPLLRAWEKIGNPRPENADLSILAKGLFHNHRFNPQSVGKGLYNDCMREVVVGGTDIFPADMVYAADCSLRMQGTAAMDPYIEE